MTLFLIGLQGMRSMNSKKGMRLTVRFEQSFYDRVENYRKAHGIGTWVKALHLRDVEKDERIEELEAQIVESEKESKSVLSYLQKGFSENEALEREESSMGQVAGRDSMEFSEKACWALVYVKNKPICGDPDAPIDSHLKRHLNPQICALCQKLKKKAEVEQKKENEQKEKALQKLRRKTSYYQKSVNETVAKEKTSERDSIFRGGSTDGHW
jgi:DNA repair exonuclease SbcCD ATPase subunit